MSREFTKEAEMKRMVDLICDMTVSGATEEELERVILYSAEVINSDKSGVDWRPLYEDYVIAELEDKYQTDDTECDCDKPYIVLRREYMSEDHSWGRGTLLAGFDHEKDANEFAKAMNDPNVIVLGPKVCENEPYEIMKYEYEHDNMDWAKKTIIVYDNVCTFPVVLRTIDDEEMKGYIGKALLEKARDLEIEERIFVRNPVIESDIELIRANGEYKE